MMSKKTILFSFFIILAISANVLAVEKATEPVPENGAEGVSEEYAIYLRWTPGDSAESHDVYLGTDETAVTNATTTSAEFVDNKSRPSYAFMDFDDGIQYFWRIDEVTATTTIKGDVWSFTTYIYVPPTPVLWLKMDGPDSGNARLVKDYSGNGNDGTMGSSDAWIDIPGLGNAIDFDGGNWGASGIVFAGDGNDLIPDMGLTDQVTVSFWVTWDEDPDGTNYPYDGRNDNLAIEDKRILSIESPTNGKNIRNHCGTKSIWTWSAFDPEDSRFFFREGGTWGDYKRLTTTVDLTTGAFKMYIDTELYTSQTVDTNGFMDGMTSFTVGRTLWAEMDGTMTDFRIYNEVLELAQIAELVGDYPEVPKVVSPAHQSTGNPLNSILEWRAGDSAVSQSIYFDENYVAVRDANTSSSCYVGQQAETTYDPCGLELMKTYYWRVDQLDNNDEIIKKGPIWQFSTIDYVMVEDFESYDNEGNDIAAVWTDKLGEGDMQILLMNDPCISPVNSMRLRYQIPYPPYWTIADRSFSPPQDWTVNGVKILTIHYYGDESNFGLPLFVTIGDGTTDANVVVTDVNTLVEGWQEINVSLPEIAAAGVDLNNVSYMEIGLGDGTNLGMSGSKWDILYIDDILCN